MSEILSQKFVNKLREISVKDVFHCFKFIGALPIALIYKRFRKGLWLVCENKDEARDNGFYFFKYVIDNKLRDDIVYAIDYKSIDFSRVNKLGKTVKYGSFRHWILYLTAEKNISTQKGGKPNAAVCYFLEVYGFIKNKRVFLQHGVIMNELPFLFYKNSKIGLFMTSTEREYNYIKDNFGYNEDSVKLVGLCRFDDLHDCCVEEKTVLIMPTWRSWISPPSNQKVKKENRFETSEYFYKWQSLLHNKDLQELIEKENVKVVFYPHREMEKYMDMFPIVNSNIIVADRLKDDLHELIKKSSVLITDYSSVSIDFAYMGKPLIYYQFDYNKFRKMHYKSGYFDYVKDGFGMVCYEEDSVVDEVIHLYRQKFESDDIYKGRQEKFFTLRDTSNCKRNYDCILKY